MTGIENVVLWLLCLNIVRLLTIGLSKLLYVKGSGLLLALPLCSHCFWFCYIQVHHEEEGKACCAFISPPIFTMENKTITNQHINPDWSNPSSRTIWQVCPAGWWDAWGFSKRVTVSSGPGWLFPRRIWMWR